MVTDPMTPVNIKIQKNFLVFTGWCVHLVKPKAGNRIPNRSVTQIAVPKQGQVGYCRRNVSVKHHLHRDNSREQ
jgi:hypothetical protein